MKKSFPLLLVLTALLAACGSQKRFVRPQLSTDTAYTALSDSAVALSRRLPQRELRGVWMATVGYIDWPMKAVGEQRQKQLFSRYLDSLQSLHVNTIFFQVRPKADAFYDSPHEPWSEYLTGHRGQDPGYDPLAWLISETHRRGMSFHAWMNPYRVATRDNRGQRFPQRDKGLPKHWTKDYATVRMLNPALPEVRQRVCRVVEHLLQHYDVDGIHFDDYFYPALAKGEKMGDDREFKHYGRGFASVADFRRAMVDSLILSVSRTVKATRPHAVFSISPQGNPENNYSQMYADIDLWTRRGWIDVIIPQLYWSTERYFRPRLDWFTQHAGRSHLAVGVALYRFSPTAKSPYYRTADDLGLQLDLCRRNSVPTGIILYSAHWLFDNPVGIDRVIASRFSQPVLPPYLGLGTEPRAAAPAGLTLSGNHLSWQAAEGCYYAVYRETSSLSPAPSEGGGDATAAPSKGSGKGLSPAPSEGGGDATAAGSKDGSAAGSAAAGQQADAELVGVTDKPEMELSRPGTYFVTAVRWGDNAQSLPSKSVRR